jgi:glycosyltransferase involved in cell wall biosynthesis
MVQNPSLMLALLVLALRPLFRYRLVVDAHNEAVRPFIHTAWPVPFIARLLLRRADLTIVTNGNLAGVVEKFGGRPFVLSDSLPQTPLEPGPARHVDGAFEIMVVSTYAPDEPIAEILDCAAKLGGEFRFHITGNDRKLAPSLRAKLASNVRLTGFLPEHDYWALMRDSHLVLDLTLMPDCLVCGAYEALALQRPMVLSDSEASRELFGQVAILSGSRSADIEQSLRQARAAFENLARAMPEARTGFERRWRARGELLLQWIRSP